MRFCGVIGFATVREGTGDNIGIDEDVIEERLYFGDVLRNSRKYETQSDSVLDDLKIDNKISVVGDEYIWDHFYKMKYVQWMGALWKITNVEVQRPRLILTIGGVYNGPTAGPSRNPCGSV